MSTTATIKQRDRLCYKVWEHEDESGERVKSVCTRDRDHVEDDCSGHLVIDDIVPPDAEIVMMQCEGYDVPVAVWTTNIADSETDPPTLTDWHWMAYVPVPYDWCTLGDATREAAIVNAAQYLQNFAEENPDAAGSSLRCFKCQCKLHGDYVVMDGSRHDEGLVGFSRVEDPFDIKKTAEFGPLAVCLKCGDQVITKHDDMH